MVVILILWFPCNFYSEHSRDFLLLDGDLSGASMLCNGDAN